MKIEPNTIVTDLNPVLRDVKIITGGYVTGKEAFRCKFLEKVASANNGERIDFYEDGQAGLFSFHFGRSLGPGKFILAIDSFPSLSAEEAGKALDVLMREIRRRR